MTPINVTFECPECKTEFKFPVFFVGRKNEFDIAKKQIAPPYLEEPRQILKQHDCQACGKSHQVPVLIHGTLIRSVV